MKNYAIQALGIFLWGCLFMSGMRIVDTLWPRTHTEILCVVFSEDDSHCTSYAPGDIHRFGES